MKPRYKTQRDVLKTLKAAGFEKSDPNFPYDQSFLDDPKLAMRKLLSIRDMGDGSARTEYAYLKVNPGPTPDREDIILKFYFPCMWNTLEGTRTEKSCIVWYEEGPDGLYIVDVISNKKNNRHFHHPEIEKLL